MKLKSFYFMIMTIVGLIGLLVGYGTAIYNKLQLTLITDEEYLVGSYRVDTYICENERERNPKTDREEQVEKTQEEIDACIQKQEDTALKQRAYDSKQVFIGGITRGSIFLLLFVVHGLVFYRSKNN